MRAFSTFYDYFAYKPSICHKLAVKRRYFLRLNGFSGIKSGSFYEVTFAPLVFAFLGLFDWSFNRYI